MMLYLTGANNSLKISESAPQNDPRLSLGGYVSSTPVPNSAINSLFDQISLLTLQNKPVECMAFALVNKSGKTVSDIEVKIAGSDDDICQFEIGAIKVNDFQMESLHNRYQLPIGVSFHNADFRRAGVQVTIVSPARLDEEFVLTPFNVLVKSPKTYDYKGTYQAIKDAFNGNPTWEVTYVSEKVFRIEQKNYDTVTPVAVDVIAEEGGVKLEFDGDFRNSINNTLLIVDKMEPNECIGIWLKRSIKETAYKTCEQLFEDYDSKVEEKIFEKVSLIFNYNPVESREYSDDYDEQEYS